MVVRLGVPAVRVAEELQIVVAVVVWQLAFEQGTAVVPREGVAAVGVLVGKRVRIRHRLG